MNLNNSELLFIDGIVVQGHRVASGQGAKNPYPAGTLELQLPYFKRLGLDLSMYYQSTLNISIHPHIIRMKQPELTFRHVEWTDLHPPEDFSFSRGSVLFNKEEYHGWIYYPHPETKKNHFQSPCMLEFILPFIPEINYGSSVKIGINPHEIDVTQTS